MKTIILEKPGSFAEIQRQSPNAKNLKPDEALVRIRKIGICGTDYHAFKGNQPFFTYPRVLGHELGVEVLAVGGDVENVQPGNLCAVEPYLSCGSCIACRNGKTNCCVNMQVLGVHRDGGLCEEMILPADKLHSSAKLSLEQLALVETLGIGAHAVYRGNVSARDTVLVIGAGPIGLSVIQFARLSGARTIVFDLNADRLAFVKKNFGIEEVIGPGSDAWASSERSERPAEDAEKKLLELTNGELATAVFDASGHPASMDKSFHFVSHGGRLVFVGLHQGNVSFPDPLFHRREMTVLGSRNALPGDFRKIISGMEAGAIDTRPWITHRAAFSDMIPAFDTWLKPESRVIKAMVEI
ncbi:MAG: zinc-binding alcohol dehydrogenase family protein [Spirochaetia bacterium]|nr:zinc-binding alcohol dehydrogenase family protein [Spirochaetia bacterium]